MYVYDFAVLRECCGQRGIPKKQGAPKDRDSDHLGAYLGYWHCGSVEDETSPRRKLRCGRRRGYCNTELRSALVLKRLEASWPGYFFDCVDDLVGG
ncbi:hypothetical protein MTO96_045177 [Rhipicephalus appendiculatus]